MALRFLPVIANVRTSSRNQQSCCFVAGYQAWTPNLDMLTVRIRYVLKSPLNWILKQKAH